MSHWALCHPRNIMLQHSTNITKYKICTQDVTTKSHSILKTDYVWQNCFIDCLDFPCQGSCIHRFNFQHGRVQSTSFPHGAANGPKVFMTDNYVELKEAIQQNWPDSTQVLCVFHLLQQVWRWLHDWNHGIATDDRPHILLAIQTSSLCWTQRRIQIELWKPSWRWSCLEIRTFY